jgi:hypothetical protein
MPKSWDRFARPGRDVGNTMAKKNSKATWSSVKAQLQQLDRGPLVSLLGDLYRSSPENRRFLHARLLGSQLELDKYRKLVVDAVYLDPFSQRPVRVKEAERLIRHYRQATNDAEGTVDLMLSFVEAGTDQAADLGYGGSGTSERSKGHSTVSRPLGLNWLRIRDGRLSRESSRSQPERVRLGGATATTLGRLRPR